MRRGASAAADPPAVTLVAPDVGPGGGYEHQVMRLAEGLLERGVEVVIVSRTCEVPPESGLRWARVRGPARPAVAAMPWFWLLGSAVAARRGRGLLHTHGAVIGNRADVTTVHYCHTAYLAEVGHPRESRPGLAYRLNAWAAERLGRLAERVAFRPSRTRRLVAPAPGGAAELRRHFRALAGAVTSIPYRLDLARFRPASDEARVAARERLGLPATGLVALFVGGDWNRKGLQHAVDAVARAPAWRLLVAGRGDEAAPTARARDRGAEGRVVLAGHLPDPVTAYHAADAFVLPTSYETFSLATYEAAACGLPLLVGRVHGVEDLVVDGENGWFVRRDADSIASRLGELEDADLRERMGEAARGGVAARGPDRTVDLHLELYRELAREDAR